MKHYTVRISAHAARDLERIQDYLFEHESPDRAEHIATKIEQAIASLSQAPHRGVVPAELEQSGQIEIREVFFKPYRIFYEVTENHVEVIFISDGRRNMAALLQERLTRP